MARKANKAKVSEKVAAEQQVEGPTAEQVRAVLAAAEAAGWQAKSAAVLAGGTAVVRLPAMAALHLRDAGVDIGSVRTVGRTLVTVELGEETATALQEAAAYLAADKREGASLRRSARYVVEVLCGVARKVERAREAAATVAAG